MSATKKATRSFTEGPLFFQILLFTLPLMATALLSIFYNTADNIVVGRFSGDDLALAAVGSTTGLTALIVTFLMGFSAGCGVVIAQRFGAKDGEGVSRAAHTAITFAVIGGLAFMIMGLAVSRPALVLMGTKAEILDNALLYLRIICIGIPGSGLYNFGATILRSTGNSKTPLLILSSSGLLNVLLNLLFVIVLHLGVAGVAVATIISQYMSAVWVTALLFKKKNECYGLRLSQLGIDKKSLFAFFRYGLPQGIQNSLFAFTAVFMTGAINTFPTAVVSARTIQNNVDQLCHSTIASFGSAAVTVVGQNYGAKKPERIKKSVIYLAIQVATLGILLGNVLLLFADKIAWLFIDASNPDASAILDYAMQMLRIMLTFSFLNGTWQMLSGAVRGMGYSFSAMIISLFGAAFFRVFWILVIFPLEPMHNIPGLFTVFPFSWTITGVLLAVNVLVAYRSLKRRVAAENG